MSRGLGKCCKSQAGPCFKSKTSLDDMRPRAVSETSNA